MKPEWADKYDPTDWIDWPGDEPEPPVERNRKELTQYLRELLPTDTIDEDSIVWLVDLIAYDGRWGGASDCYFDRSDVSDAEWAKLVADAIDNAEFDRVQMWEARVAAAHERSRLARQACERWTTVEVLVRGLLWAYLIASAGVGIGLWLAEVTK
jgi:hypothetical protein